MLPDESEVQVAGSSMLTRHERLLLSKRRSSNLSQIDHHSSLLSTASSNGMRYRPAKCLHLEEYIKSLTISHLKD